MERKWTPNESEVSSIDDLPDILDRNPRTMIHVWAPWNGIDKLQIDEIESSQISENGTYLRTINVDRKEFTEILLSWDITNVPALVFFKNGKRIKTIIGLRKSAQLDQIAKDILNQNP